jgi:hypothetical protein
MRVFIERFVLAILASLVVLLAAINPMGFSWPLRIISIVIIVVVAGVATYLACWDEWRWERLRAAWWLWSMLGLTGGVALALWLSPLLIEQPAPSASDIISPNPIHDAATKWKMARNLHHLSSNKLALGDNCEIVIVRYQLPYSETYSNDLKEVLGIIGWKFHEVFSTEQLFPGLSLKSFVKGLPRTCLDALKQRFDNDAQPGSRVGWDWIDTPTKYMAECSGQCVEIDIGNDPRSQ